MIHDELKWTCRDGVRIYGCRWLPEGKPVKAAVGIVHGLGEHCGAYGHVAKPFTERGYAVYAFDQRGHGRTEGRRGDCPGYDSLLEPVELLLEDMKREFGGMPLFLYSHSMGGNLVLNYVLKHSPPLAGAVAAGPWLRLAAAAPPLPLVLGRIKERVRRNYRYPLGNQLSTTDPDMLRRYFEDPLRHARITLRTFSAVSRAGRWALRHAHKLRLPLLLMHGSEDRVTSCRASRLFATRAGGSCTFREWSGFRHELHTEAGRREVMKFALDWMDNRCFFSSSNSMLTDRCQESSGNLILR